ncbi:hypothetical protein PanWU01x14_259450, partial [Parasponia andersonii]
MNALSKWTATSSLCHHLIIVGFLPRKSRHTALATIQKLGDDFSNNRPSQTYQSSAVASE